MRIAQVAPLVESVPPKLYGGTERVVAWLVDELVSLGHEVTLFASGDSKSAAKLHAVWPRALRLGRPRTDPMVAQAALLEAVARHATEFDIIHAHIDWLHLPLLSRLGVPFLTTCRGRMDLPGFADVVRRFPDAPFVSISDNQRLPLSEANWLGTVYHGLPSDHASGGTRAARLAERRAFDPRPLRPRLRAAAPRSRHVELHTVGLGLCRARRAACGRADHG